jgi:hypothetical protein
LTVITQKDLKSYLEYSPFTGKFFWIKKPAKQIIVGSQAGVNCNGYWYIGLLGKRYYAHRLAWFYMTGNWPQNQIDHINGNKSDNRWCNLREATGTQNQANRKLNKNSTSGYKGVHFCKRTKRWSAFIQFKGKNRFLGRFDTQKEAHLAYINAANNFFGKYANYG